MRKTVAVLLGMMLAFTFGCSAKGSIDQVSSDVSTVESVAPDAPSAPALPPTPMPELSRTSAESYPHNKDVEIDYGGRKIIRSFDFAIETKSFDDDLQTLMDLCSSLNGYIEHSTINGKPPETYNDSVRNASITFRIPKANIDAFATGVKQSGTLTRANENAEDVTEHYFDLETRLDVLKTQLERLKSILVKTNNLADILALESELSRVTIEIEDLTTNIKRYDKLMAYVCVNMSIVELRKTDGSAIASGDFNTRISDGFNDVVAGICAFFENAFAVILIYSPIWVSLGIIVAITVVIVQKRNKKHTANNKKDQINDDRS